MPHKVTIIRHTYSDEGTFGVLISGNLKLVTGELPWRENAANISCIPEGEYNVIWSYSPRFRKETYLLTDVKGRTGIRFHAANVMGDKTKGYSTELHGCIALGKFLGYIKGQAAVLKSATAIEEFAGHMSQKSFKLVVQGDNYAGATQ